MMRRARVILILVGVLVLGSGLWGGHVAWGSPIAPGFDLLTTPLVPAVIPGLGTVQLQGRPIGPGNTDTIVERTTGLPAGGTGLIDTELVALSLESATPVSIPGFGGFFDVFITLDPSTPSLGQINVTTHDDTAGGGTFDSFFDVFTEITLTPVGGGTPMTVRQHDTLQSIGTPWSHTPGAGYINDPLFPAGGFYITAAGIDHQGPHPHVDYATPEPATLLLFASGLAGLIGVGLCKRRVHKA